MTDNQLTNEQLIELVQQKAPEELTSEQIELLRERLTTSPELRSALLDRLQLETYLTAALGRCEVSLDEVLSQARNQQASAGWLPWTALALCGLFLIGCGILLSRAVFFAPLDRTPRVAEKTPSNPPEVDPSPAMPGEGGETSGPVGENTPPVEPPGEASPEEQTGEENVIVAAGGAGGLSLEIGAEQFTSGSVSVDRAPLGDEEVAFIFTEATPSFVEYEFELPREANCEIRLRYAAFESRPLNLTVNGKVAPATVAGEATGGWMPDSQKWFSAGEFPLKEGKNRLRFVAQPAFPHLSRLLIREPKPVTAVAVAQPVKPPTGGETQVPDGEEPGPNVPAGPWAEGLAGESPAYSLAAFRKFDFSKSVLQEADLKRWFNGVAGAYSRFYQGRVENAPCGGIDGTFRLAAPWPENAVLKFAPADCERLRIHLFHGRQGATLVHYRQHDDRWAGYVSTRNAGEPAPDRLALTSTDDQRNRRTEARFQASYELRWQAGEVVLSRGDVPLLRVPLAEPPEEILFAGKTLLPGLEMYLSEPFPLPAETPAAEPRPASEFVWNEERIGAGAKVERRDDGAITLIGDAAEGRGWLTTPLPNPGLTEVIFELSEVSQGMGVYLGRSPPGGNPKEAGSPDEAVLFTFDRRTGWTCAQWGNIWDQPERDLEPYENAAMPPISDPLWIKLTLNCGAARFWMSADGRHWAEPHFSQQHRPPHVSHIGVFHPEKREKARITVKSISLRPFTAVRALASPAALERAPEIAEQPTLPAWVAHTLAARPSDIEEGDWLRACAVQTLARGCSRDFGWELFRRLFQSARELPGETRLAALEEAALVLPVLDDAGRLQQTVDMFLEAADDAGGPYALAHLPLMTAPLLSWHRFQPFDAEAVRAELLGLLYAGKWHETLELCRRLRFFEATRQLPFVSWADFTAQRELPGHGAGLNLNSLKPEWQQPLVEELSKDAYNLQAELRAILESDAIDDAVRLMTSVEPNLIEGVAPSFSDRRLLVSLPISLRLAAQEHPSLRDSMQRQFGELAALRVRQALSAGDESAVELAALQFDGTSAAAEAHQWLGDRALSAGRFHIALAEYRRASETSSALLRHDLAARQRLAAAFLGREFGEPASRTVRLGEMVVSAEEFEAICGQMRARGAEGAHANLESVPVIPPVGAMKAEAKARFDGASGQNPNDRVNRFIGQFNTPWWAHQASVQVVDDTLYVSNRFHLAAYDLTNGQRRWQTAPLPGRGMRRTHDFPLVPMQPHIFGDRIYARLLYGAGTTLACFNRENGQLIWASAEERERAVISDPLRVDTEIVVLLADWQNQREMQVFFARFDAESGEITQQTPLLALRESWKQRWGCSLLPLDDGLLALFGGAIVSCDYDGRLRWIRRQVITPLEEDPTSTNQFHHSPIIEGTRVFVAQPGVRAVQCLEMETGRLLWQEDRAELLRILGVRGGRLFLETAEGIESLESDTGETVWSLPSEERLEGFLLGAEQLLLARQTRAAEGDQRPYPQLAWIDLESGRLLGTADLPDQRDAEPRFGPLVAHGDKLWAFFGRGINDVNRDLLQLHSTGEMQVATPQRDSLNQVWIPEIDKRLRSGAAQVLPEWRLVSVVPAPSGFRADIHGEKEVMLAQARSDAPAVWARWIEVPAGSRVKLAMRAGNDPGKNWSAEVRFAGTSQWRTTREWNGESKPFVEWVAEFDVPEAGSGWLTVHGAPVEGEAPLYWKKLELTIAPR